MASTSPGYGITIRVDGPASAQPVSEITQAILAAGAAITALDVVESVLDRVVIDVTCDAIDAEHAEAITAAHLIQMLFLIPQYLLELPRYKLQLYQLHPFELGTQ